MNNYEKPEDVTNGRLNFIIVFLDTDYVDIEWSFYGFAETQDGAEVKRSRAVSKGLKNVRIFGLTELTTQGG